MEYGKIGGLRRSQHVATWCTPSKFDSNILKHTKCFTILTFFADTTAAARVLLGIQSGAVRRENEFEYLQGSD